MSLNYMSISLFHRIIEIADEVDDLTRVRVNTLELTHLIDNIDDVIEKEEMEEKEEVEEKVKIIGSRPWQLEEEEEKEKEEEKKKYWCGECGQGKKNILLGVQKSSEL